MDTTFTLLILIVSCNLRVVAQFTAGGCTFDDGPAQCDYQQDLYDDFDWTHVSVQEAPYLSTELPQGSYMMVDSSQHDSGEKARIQLPVMKENDTHCIDFNYLLYTKDGSSPGTLNILVKVNKGPLANPIWNVTSFTGRDWLRAELAVSTFWPNEYQVIFEAEVSEGKMGYIAIDDIQVLSYPCDKSPHFLRLGDVEVNAGQNATFQCIATGRDAVNNKLWLQKRHGEDIPVAQTKNINHRRFAASFRLREVTNLDQDLYRCVTQSDRGSGVSNFAELIVREPPRPIAPPQLLGVGPTYLLIQLNANSIFGDGPIILKEVEYRMTSGSWIETHAVNAPNYKLWHLDPDTEYEIRVLLTRPGEGGTGQSGPPLITRTKCAEPMRTPKSLKIAETQARFIAVDWESLGYNITRCHTFNVTICYHYFHSNNESKADCLDMDPKAPRHVVGNLPPYTNVSLKMILTNPEGRKESDEVVIQTDEDVPNPVPSESMKAMPFEDKIFLHWKEPLEPNGVITQYEISYSSIRSFDPAVDVAKRPLTVALKWNSTHHVFSQLHPGTTYQFIIRASTVKGFGPPTVVNVTTNISAPSIPDYDMTETCLNETATTITVLLKPATAKGAPISAYQIVVEELNPHRNKREASSLECYQVPVTYQSAASGGSPYYFAAELPPGSLPDPAPFTVGDNKTYNGFWNPPLAPRKNYNIYFQAVSSVEKETKTQCVRVATKAATEEPEVIPDPAKQTEVVKIAGISAGVLVFILLLLVVILVIKKRRSYYSYSYYLKLAKKRKDVIGTTRQEMTHMVNAMDRSYADQSTLHAEDPLAVTFMDSHNFSNRYENHTAAAAAAESSRLLDVPRYHCEGTESPYQTGQLHPAIRVADLLQHINLMKTSDSYGFKEEYESFFEGQSASWDVAKKEQNRTKNRYGNIIAYDHSRVILQPMEDDPSSDYINANYIDIWLYRDGYQRPSHYIATQGPVHETVYDFWRMIWQEQSACVVMVTNLVEVGRVKCYKYWPDDADVYGDFKVTFLEVEPLAEYVVRTFTLERRGFNEMREVKQFNFTGWPDHGVPYHATGLLSFIRRVKMSNPPSAGPIVVHCSAGAGRTGCYIVIDIMLDMAEREGVVDIYNCVKALRSRRINMVQTEEQYIFIHDAILEACLCGETTIPACEFKATYYDMIRIDSQSNSSHLKDEFQTLNSVTPQPQPEDCSIALLPRNHEKNRFMDMLPPDRCLPFLITIDGESSNYISAALMDPSEEYQSYRQPAAFIVTQHPLPNTVKDFWRLVYDYGCTSLVMLNEIDLAQGCPQYWPEEGILRYGPIQVECMSCSMDCDVISRLFRICNLTRPQEGYLMVRQFQYLGWASHREVPASKRSFLKLILQVDKWQDECEEGEGRTIIHCLNGGGRSGMFCAISIVCEMIKRQNVVDVFHAVKSLRNSKSNMVESPEQYRFCYDLALEYLESS
ncbi:receptor-type tyrosine-protein phosphatase kappa-like isoform X15 [Acipenser ruthenus]|uniref:receptor-type tyrosine-protein phosphatase kappa-like isoform X15 n=1 Tax=Acipenser ruthenus TaxID=7906 RepID=UPI002740FEF4|nr:receptor-type tyrosine-protein phosphatase kappa-like isoform X15 [Acipenser ruthenus]